MRGRPARNWATTSGYRFLSHANPFQGRAQCVWRLFQAQFVSIAGNARDLGTVDHIRGWCNDRQPYAPDHAPISAVSAHPY